MGRHAKSVPTSKSVGRAIANLKPEKKAEWQRLAEEGGWNFEEYVIARIKRNVEYRSRQTSGAGTAGAGAQETTADEFGDGFESFSTQQIEDALSRRKRRRRGSWIDSTERYAAPEAAANPGEANGTLEKIAARQPPGPILPLAQRSDSFLGLHLHPSQEAPPSGGAASRADTSFARTTSFVIATEGGEDVSSISSSNLPSPISPCGHGSLSADEYQQVGLETQDWREFLESTQGRAMDSPDHFATPRTHRWTPSPKPEGPAHNPLKHGVNIQDHPAPHPLRWNLKPENIPAGASRLGASAKVSFQASIFRSRCCHRSHSLGPSTKCASRHSMSSKPTPHASSHRRTAP